MWTGRRNFVWWPPNIGVVSTFYRKSVYPWPIYCIPVSDSKCLRYSNRVSLYWLSCIICSVVTRTLAIFLVFEWTCEVREGKHSTRTAKRFHPSKTLLTNALQSKCFWSRCNTDSSHQGKGRRPQKEMGKTEWERDFFALFGTRAWKIESADRENPGGRI